MLVFNNASGKWTLLVEVTAKQSEHHLHVCRRLLTHAKKPTMSKDDIVKLRARCIDEVETEMAKGPAFTPQKKPSKNDEATTEPKEAKHAEPKAKPAGEEKADEIEAATEPKYANKKPKEETEGQGEGQTKSESQTGEGRIGGYEAQ